jgi:nitrate reductase delta subunit
MMIADCYEALARMLDYPAEKQCLQKDYDILGSYLAEQKLNCHIGTFADFADISSLAAIQEEYVATFDFNPATSPYLGHHLFGDNQKKGGYMIALKQEFSRYGYVPVGTELPDHVSVVLGFLAHLSRQEGSGVRRTLLAECVLPGMERLNEAFAARQNSPWKVLVDAASLLCAADCTEVTPC